MPLQISFNKVNCVSRKPILYHYAKNDAIGTNHTGKADLRWLPEGRHIDIGGNAPQGFRIKQ
jgi:hypothetical protein